MMQYTKLGNTGIQVSRLGLGGAPFGGGFGETNDDIVQNVVHAAIDSGITFMDTAPLYGNGASELRIGKALAGGKRHQVVLATKAVMRGEAYSYENTMRSVEESLKRLGTDYIDLIQLHEVEMTTFEEGMNGTVAAFLKLKEQGKVRAIGVNGGKVEQLFPFIRTGQIDTVQMWGRYTLIDCSAKEELFPLARENKVGVINGSVLAMGILADAPASFLLPKKQLLEEAEKRKQQISFLRKTEPKGLIEPAMRFSLNCPDIAVTLMGTTSVQSLLRNVACCDGTGLPEEEQARVFQLLENKKPLFEY
ncbi:MULTISPECIES: aldo/keto reductase [unclassified Paenibacillus]|uniref:aldo/keto reductase n=1 Tax=unclassified Paenibacillus TaxID=185978 RepID=UPI002F40E8E1